MHQGNEIHLVGFSSPPQAAAQSALGASVTPVDFTDVGVSLPLCTFVSSVLISVQALEQGRKGISSQVLGRMTDVVSAVCEASLLNDDGTSGTLLGLRNVPSASTQTYTSSSPTAAEFISNLESLIRKVETGRGGSPVVLMHSRRLSLVTSGARFWHTRPGDVLASHIRKGL